MINREREREEGGREKEREEENRRERERAKERGERERKKPSAVAARAGSFSSRLDRNGPILSGIWSFSFIIS